jgi:hypothetical protein
MFAAPDEKVDVLALDAEWRRDELAGGFVSIEVGVDEALAEVANRPITERRRL